MEPDDDLPEFDLPFFQKVALRVQVLVLAILLRATDLLLVTLRPRLVRPYLAIWWAELRRTPYSARRSFERVRAVRSTQQPFRDLIYGEIPLVSALIAFRRAGVRKGSRFLDLGAGRGRALIAAAWLGAEARGVELLDEHVSRVTAPLAKAGITLERGDLLERDLSFATHVFSNWLAFSDETRRRVAERLRGCTEGTRVMVVGQRLDEAFFTLRARRWLVFTWGVEPVGIYERRARGD